MPHPFQLWEEKGQKTAYPRGNEGDVSPNQALVLRDLKHSWLFSDLPWYELKGGLKGCKELGDKLQNNDVLAFDT